MVLNQVMSGHSCDKYLLNPISPFHILPQIGTTTVQCNSMLQAFLKQVAYNSQIMLIASRCL